MWCMDYRSSLTLNSLFSGEVTRSLPHLNFGLTEIQTLGQTFVTAREVATLTPGGP